MLRENTKADVRPEAMSLDAKISPELRHLIPSLLTAVDELYNQLVGALESDRHETAIDIAHGLKGVGMQYGWLDIAQAAFELEQALLAQNTVQAFQALASIGAQLDVARQSAYTRFY